MEKDQNPMPQFDLLPGLPVIRKVGRFLGSLLVPFHTGAPDCMSTHNRGGGPALDRALYEQGELDYGTNEQSL